MIYIKKEEDVAVAYCDVGTLEAITQSREADLVVSDAEWAKAGFHAYIDNTGKVVLGYPALTLNELKEEKKAQIDAETSAAILAGFDYAVDGVTYHFSYALDDQQNFSDTANVCIMKQAGMPGLPDSVMWNAYRVPGGELERLTFDASGFLALYAGGERKAAVEAATTPEEVEAA